MRVAIINSVYGKGSTGKIVREIEKRVIESGNECKCYYGRKSGNENGGEYFGSKFSVLSHALFSRIFGRQGLYSRKATKQLIKKLKEYKPDVINLHNIHGYYLNYKILFKYLKQSNIPVVWTLHDLWAITGHCACFEEFECEKWKTGCVKCTHKKEYPKAIFENSKKNYRLKQEIFSLQNLIFVSPSEWLKNNLKESFLKQYHCEVINNGIDLSIFSKKESDFVEKYNLQNKKIILGVSPFWTIGKGANTFNKLAQDLDDSFVVVTVGESQGVTFNEKVRALPKTSSIKELVEIYSASDLFINPTLIDNFPTVNVEALACGLPVVTYNTGGSGEMIDDTCGTKVEKGNYQELLKAIVNFDYTTKTAENCQNKAKQFDSKDKFNRYIDLFLEVINESVI